MPDPARLLRDVDGLIDEVGGAATARLADWKAWDIRPEFRGSVENLAAYLALRQHDLRPLQRSLMALGLSSLGRLESRVQPTLGSVRAALSALSGEPVDQPGDEAVFFAGEERLKARADRLFGARPPGRPTALMVTCPSLAADDPVFMLELAERRVDAIRINCAHDDAAAWSRMIAHARDAEAATGHRMRVFMDLAGPKIRTGSLMLREGRKRVGADDRIAVVAPGALPATLEPGVTAAVECTLVEALEAVRPGERVFIDDGKIAAVAETSEAGVLTLRVTRCDGGDAKLKPEKGLNFPDTALSVPALTERDEADLAFVAQHADAVEYSFVQSAEDVARLQTALAVARPDGWEEIGLVLKIETARAVRNLPGIVVRAGAQQPVAIMIARGDLAIEIGFARLAEMQEEILWIGEAAQVPVIWATQVLEHFVKKGVPNRAELTDAAMAVRAECVMLNKGPFLLDALDALVGLLGRMGDHVHKKTPQLRRLGSW
ncbi:pyruvate kinase [Amorphus coralli]|uniref:pyruvate kinase n=1 Tax=Amorphus coralli TaxID=340680 RepID=UPI000360A493|nr:pyruvate kinase [Amorphus coralli]